MTTFFTNSTKKRKKSCTFAAVNEQDDHKSSIVRPRWSGFRHRTSVFNILGSSGPLADSQALITERLNDYESQMDYDYIPGFEEYIRELRQQGVKTAVVTSSNQPKMKAVYAKHPEFKSLFDAILTSEDFERSKPDPDCYLKAAERFGVEPKNCVVFEDSFNGLKSGRAAGMYVIGLATTNAAEDIAPLCDKVIEDFNHL